MSEAMKRVVRVTIIKEIEIELTPTFFGPMTQAEYLAEFNKSLFPVDGIDDIFKFAARMAAHYGGGMSHDGLGLLSESYSAYPRVPDVKFEVLDEEDETELVQVVFPEGAPQ